MIKLLRKKFIICSAVSVFAVITIVFTLIAVFSVTSTNRTLDMLSDSISEGNGVFPDYFGEHDGSVSDQKPQKQPIPNEITPETRYSTRHFTVWFDTNDEVIRTNTEFIRSVDDSEAHRYAYKALEAGRERGWLNGYRYKVYSVPDGSAVVFVNGEMSRSSLTETLIISGAVLLFAAAVIILLIILLSGRIVKPASEGYEKQKQFITDANHELKTPLTLILANVDIAEDELGKNEWLDDIRAEGHRMAELVNQLVELSRMDEEGHKPCSEQIPLGQTVADIVSEFEGIARERGKSLCADIDGSITYLGDGQMIRRLIGILMDNAVKYCDEGGQISVTLKGHRRVCLTVENSYEGVDGVELERLFDRFYRADKARRFTGGYGVGLSIARSIVQKHKGQICAYKKDGCKIGFKVTL